MKYKVLIAPIEKITSPITVYFDGQVKELTNGKALTEYSLDKPFEIKCLYLENRTIVAELNISNRNESSNYICEEAKIQ